MGNVVGTRCPEGIEEQECHVVQRLRLVVGVLLVLFGVCQLDFYFMSGMATPWYRSSCVVVMSGDWALGGGSFSRSGDDWLLLASY